MMRAGELKGTIYRALRSAGSPPLGRPEPFNSSRRAAGVRQAHGW